MRTDAAVGRIGTGAEVGRMVRTVAAAAVRVPSSVMAALVGAQAPPM